MRGATICNLWGAKRSEFYIHLLTRSDSLRSTKQRKPLYCNVKLSSIGQPDRILGKDSSENIQWLIDKFCSDVQETVHLGIILTSFESKVSCFRDGLLKKKSGKCNKYLKAQKASPRCGALQTWSSYQRGDSLCLVHRLGYPGRDRMILTAE